MRIIVMCAIAALAMSNDSRGYWAALAITMAVVSVDLMGFSI